MTTQLINENKQFLSPEKYFASNKLINNGLNYHLVSVFGSQSTGKSTLLNALFGTSFSVMDESRRAQTTKGIWLGLADLSSKTRNLSAVESPSVSEPEDATTTSSSAASENSDGFVSVTPFGDEQNCILVLDVEGTDGRERGEDQDFERKAALFALATSECLLVNMWENQVGLYQGANMGLLKTVFEVNLSLFASRKKKSLILFVIRDHLGATPLANLSETLLKDLQSHWHSISKPPGLEGSQIFEFFDVQFCALPHKILMKDAFEKEVSSLAKRFIQSSSEKKPQQELTDTKSPTSLGSSSDENQLHIFQSSDYIFKPEYHRNVPIDGWSMYADQIWQQIEDNKDLDLPTQQILVARFRCDEISTEAWQLFESDVSRSSLKEKILDSSPFYTNFGNYIAGLRADALSLYDTTASRYADSVYMSKRADLEQKLNTQLSTYLKLHLQKVMESLIGTFCQFSASSYVTFYDELVTSKNDNMVKFQAECEGSSLGTLPYEEDIIAFKKVLDNTEKNLRDKQVEFIVVGSTKRIKTTIDEELESFFKKPDANLWDQIDAFFKSTIATALARYKVTDDKYAFKTGENDETILKTIQNKAWACLDSRLKEICKDNNVVTMLRENFEMAFKYDKNSLPIVWKPSDDIEGAFIDARQAALTKLDIIATAKLSSGEVFRPVRDDTSNNNDNDVDDNDIYGDFSMRISKSRKESIIDQFRRIADSIYVDAKRSTVQTATQVPFYMIVLLVVLGWNEFMAVLRSPVLFILLLLSAGGAYVTYTLNMWGPLIQVANAMANKTMEVAKEKLRESLQVSEGASVNRPLQHENDIPLQDLSEKSDSKSGDSFAGQW